MTQGLPSYTGIKLMMGASSTGVLSVAGGHSLGSMEFALLVRCGYSSPTGVATLYANPLMNLGSPIGITNVVDASGDVITGTAALSRIDHPNALSLFSGGASD